MLGDRLTREPGNASTSALSYWIDGCYPARMPGFLLCLTTCPDAETAARIAFALVEERLAACVNRVAGIASTYRWQGKILEESEVLLLIKTTAGRFEALRTRLVDLHPYDTPELLALDVRDGYAPYLDWIGNETAP